MKPFHLTALCAFALTCQCLDANRHALAQEPRATVVSNPHHLIELGPFVQLPAVRNELRLTDAQVAMVDVHAQSLKQRFEEFKERHIEDYRTSYLLYREEETLIRRLTDGVFAPDQLTRLKQLASQHLTRSHIGGFGLLSPSVKKELGITEEQAKNLDEKAVVMADQLKRREAELNRELEAMRLKMRTEVETLRTKMRVELVESLTPEQRESVKRLWGELIPIPQ